MFKDPGIFPVYPSRHYSADAAIPQTDIVRILDGMRALRLVDMTIYLRTASINISNGMVSLVFFCDGSHFTRYDELLTKSAAFWSGISA